MKHFSLMISIAATLGILYFAYINLHHSAIIMSPFKATDFEMSITHLTILIFASGSLAGFTFAAFNYSGKISSLQAYKKKFEKMSVQSDCDDTKVKALEAKIQTLEVALKNALEK